MTTTTTTSKKNRPARKKIPIKKTTLQGNAHKNLLPTGIDQEQRHAMIAETAYSIAAQRNFKSGSTMDDWLQAEADVDARFSAGSRASH